jgi:hypothetical protein
VIAVAHGRRTIETVQHFAPRLASDLLGGQDSRRDDASRQRAHPAVKNAVPPFQSALL